MGWLSSARLCSQLPPFLQLMLFGVQKVLRIKPRTPERTYCDIL